MKDKDKSLSKNVFEKAVRLLPAGENPVCAMEVGTAGGDGSTMALVKTLDAMCHRCVVIT